MKAKIEYSIECEPETDIAPEGSFDSGDAEADKALCRRIRKESEWNPWAWCMVTVTARLSGIPGFRLTGTDSLGACSYESEADFKAGGYFEGMKEAAKADLLSQLQLIQSIDIDTL